MADDYAKRNLDAQYGPARDELWVTDIARERPKLQTKFHCIEEDRPDRFSGGEDPEDRCAVFNRQLREGLGTGRPDNNDE